MRSNRFFIVLLVIFSFTLPTFAQDKKKSDEDKKSDSDKLWEQQSEQRQEEQQKRIEELNERLEELQRAKYIDLSDFLPKSRDSWVVSITSTGGFGGGTRLLAAVNSNGNFLCILNEDFKNNVLTKNISDELFPLIRNFSFSRWDFDDRTEIKGCKDCAYMTLTYQYRGGVYRYSRNDLSIAGGNIGKIYEKIINAADCSIIPPPVQ